MMNQPHEFVNKLRTACTAMGKCRKASNEAKRRQNHGNESADPVRPVTTTDPATLNANLQR